MSEKCRVGIIGTGGIARAHTGVYNACERTEIVAAADISEEQLSKRKRCYITTACVQAMGLTDSCLELQVLRNFRDKVLMPTSMGKKAVQEYYQIAPEIIQAVEEQEKANARRVWSSLYNEVRKAVSLVLSGDFERAFQHYRQATLDLKGKYLQ